MVEQAKAQVGYLDADLFVSHEGSILSNHFTCPICLGVILIPVECNECNTPYCSPCSKDQKLTCPKRCGGDGYIKLNRIILGNLNDLKFKCQYSQCEITPTYRDYQEHFSLCPEKKKFCPNNFCQESQKKLREEKHELTEDNDFLKIQVESLQLKVDQTENQKQQQIQVLRNQISDLKEQFKQKTQTEDVQYISMISDLKAQLQDLKNDNQNLKGLIASKKGSGVEESILKITCDSGHVLKAKQRHPRGSTIVNCDVCKHDKIQEHFFFYRCDSMCNYDICACCYSLKLAGQHEKVKEIQGRSKQRCDQVEELKARLLLSQIINNGRPGTSSSIFM